MNLSLLPTCLDANAVEKKMVGQYCCQFVNDNTTIALGTGSTVKYFIQALANRIKSESLQIRALSSSKKSQILAESLGINVITPLEATKIDLMVDGADQINEDKDLIKGGGGALFREKLLAHEAKQLIIIADKNKLVKTFTCKLPVEIEPFCYSYTMKRIQNLEVTVTLRIKDNKPFITDNKNYIVDIDYQKSKSSIQELDTQLKHITGVIETGLFSGLNPRIFIANKENIVELK